MEQFTINAHIRKESGKRVAKRLRAQGRIPAVAYNEKGESTMLDIDAVEFSKVWRTVTPTTLITLNIEGQESQAYIKDTEYDIKTDKNLHADFYVVSGKKALVAKFKLHYAGTPAGVLKGGFMVKHVPEIKVKALPADMPTSVTVDVSKAEIGGKITVADLNLGENVQVLTNPSSLLISIAPPKK